MQNWPFTRASTYYFFFLSVCLFQISVLVGWLLLLVGMGWVCLFVWFLYVCLFCFGGGGGCCFGFFLAMKIVKM